MPQENVNVSSDALRWFAGVLSSRQQAIFEDAKGLNSELQDLMNTGWRDQQAQRFGMLLNEFIQDYAFRFLQETESYPGKLQSLADNIDNVKSLHQR